MLSNFFKKSPPKPTVNKEDKKPVIKFDTLSPAAESDPREPGAERIEEQGANEKPKSALSDCFKKYQTS